LSSKNGDVTLSILNLVGIISKLWELNGYLFLILNITFIK